MNAVQVSATPLVLTPGEPAGIGPDLAVQLAQRERTAPLVAVADPRLLTERAEQLGLPLVTREFGREGPPEHSPGVLSVLPVALSAAVRPGHVDPANGQYVLQCLREAVDGCLDGRFAALITGPVHKAVINEAGVAFTGHTEFLAERSNTPRVVMMLATPGLRVALATTHLPLREVADAITPALLEEVIYILHRDLQRFGVKRPRILVCGLNPHAGEGGHLGREELEIIGPVLEKLRQQARMDLQGPLPADTLFVPRYMDRADAVLAMYHDQGLPVLKHKGFGKAVNVTLGLPFVRTSVDHGTALDLAGTGQADIGSLEYAIEVALEQLRHRPPEANAV